MGKQKIVISEQDNIATLFEDDKAVEFIIHRGDVLLGDVYLAQVENILPSIDAAFVNVGTERMGFLHSSDVLGRGTLKSRLQPKQNIVVQVMKEPTGHKGPRVTMNIALPGRFLVLMPFSKGTSISRKIVDQKERSRLKSITSLIKPAGVGIIIRTEAENQSEPEIQEDLETLLERWQQCVALADTANPPSLLYRDQDILYRVIREMVTEDVKEIVVDSAFGQQRAQHLLQNWSIDQPIKVSHYQGPHNINVGCGIDKEIKMALQTRVPLPSGGYLYIQPTEALSVIDVNSGKFTSLDSQAETIRLTNLEAAKEIARQLRLRNIGGMIIVDFIDMESRADQLSVLEFFENELANDKAKPQIGQLSDLGLVEMTRHRQGQSLSEIFTKKCMACSGSGLNIEDFNWSPSANDVARGRSKMPLRTQRHARPGDRSGGGEGGGGRFNRQQGGGGQGGQKFGGSQGGARGQQGPTGVNAHGDKQGAAYQQQQRMAVTKPGRPSIRKILETQPAEQLVWQNFINHAQKLSDQEEKTATQSMNLEELFRYYLFKRCGTYLATGVKVAYLPMGINSIFIRINPASSDIFTLVHAIEGPGGMIDVEDDSTDEGSDEDEEAIDTADMRSAAAEEDDDDDEDGPEVVEAGEPDEDDDDEDEGPELVDSDDDEDTDEEDDEVPMKRLSRNPLLGDDDLETLDDEDDDDAGDEEGFEAEGFDEEDSPARPQRPAPQARRGGGGSRPPNKGGMGPRGGSDRSGGPSKPRRGRPPKRMNNPEEVVTIEP